MIAAHPVPRAYRQPLLGAPDPLLRRAFAVSGSLGVLWLLLVWIAPAPQVHERSVDELPERLARLIVEEPAPVAMVAAPVPAPRVDIPVTPRAPEATAPSTPEPATPTPPRERTRAPRPELPTERGTAGREQARAEVTEQLAQVTRDVDATLQSLASVLPNTESSAAPSAPARRGGRAVRAGRGADAVGNTTTRSTTAGADLASTGLGGGVTDLGAIGAFDLATVSGQAGTASSGASDGAAGGTGDRSASSLMAVVRRYAPGIRYCYDTALESDRSLRGKMVFRITVAADGSVEGVTVVEDSLGSADVRRCALAQIEAWRFGAAGSASVFDAPFVFRPTP